MNRADPEGAFSKSYNALVSRGSFSAWNQEASKWCCRLCQSGAASALSAVALAGWIPAQAAAPVVLDTAMVPQINIQSDIGVTNQIQYCTDLAVSNWVVLTNLVVEQSPYWFLDVGAPPTLRRFYRVIVWPNDVPSGTALIPAGSFTMGNCMDPGTRGWLL